MCSGERAQPPGTKSHLRMLRMLTFASKCCLRELCVFTPLSAWKNTPGLHPPWIPTSRKFFQVCSTLETCLLGRWLQNELRGCPKS